MFWLPLIFGAAGVAGAIMQANGKKYIDPAWLDEHFGGHAFAQEFKKTFDALQGSSYGQEMINNAMSQGQQMANTIRQNATNAGFGGAEGVQSGGSLFATSTADQAPSSLRRMAQQQLAQAAMAQTQNFMNNKMSALVNDKGRDTGMGAIGKALTGAGMAGLEATMSGGKSGGGGGGGGGSGDDAGPGTQVDEEAPVASNMQPVNRQTIASQVAYQQDNPQQGNQNMRFRNRNKNTTTLASFSPSRYVSRINSGFSRLGDIQNSV